MKSAVSDSSSLAAAAEAVPRQRRSPVWPYLFGIAWLFLAGNVAVTMRQAPPMVLIVMILSAALFLYACLRACSRLAQGIALVFLCGTGLLVYDYGLHLPAPVPSLPFTSPPEVLLKPFPSPPSS